MALSHDPSNWNKNTNDEMRWHLHRAQEMCPHADGCKGPTVSNLGNVESGFIAISACREACANCIRAQINDSIVFPDSTPDPVLPPEPPHEEVPSVVTTVDEDR